MGGNRWDNEMEQDRIRQQSHRILNALLACVRSSPVRFKSLTKPIKGVSRRQSYTYLNMPSVARKPWQQHCDPTKDLTNSNSSLMNNLLRNQKLPHVRRSSLIAQDGVAKSAPPVDMGTFDMPKPASLNDFVVNPLFRLRGMDVFTANGGDPEANIADHPWLIQNGLRDKPTFVVNAMVQWGNIVLYFEMPEWVRDWDSIMEKDNDPDDVKALKVRNPFLYLVMMFL